MENMNNEFAIIEEYRRVMKWRVKEMPKRMKLPVHWMAIYSASTGRLKNGPCKLYAALYRKWIARHRAEIEETLGHDIPA